MTHFLLQKLHSEIFRNIARINDMKGWKSLVSLRIMFHVPTRLSINIANEHTAYASLFQSNDHQIQILKKKKCKRSPNFRFLRCKVIILRGVCSNSLFVLLFLEYGKIYNYFEFSRVIFFLQDVIKQKYKTKKCDLIIHGFL